MIIFVIILLIALSWCILKCAVISCKTPCKTIETATTPSATIMLMIFEAPDLEPVPDWVAPFPDISLDEDEQM